MVYWDMQELGEGVTFIRSLSLWAQLEGQVNENGESCWANCPVYIARSKGRLGVLCLRLMEGVTGDKTLCSEWLCPCEYDSMVYLGILPDECLLGVVQKGKWGLLKISRDALDNERVTAELKIPCHYDEIKKAGNGGYPSAVLLSDEAEMCYYNTPSEFAHAPSKRVYALAPQVRPIGGKGVLCREDDSGRRKLVTSDDGSLLMECREPCQYDYVTYCANGYLVWEWNDEYWYWDGSEVKDNLSLGKGNLCFFCTEGDQSVYYRIDGIKSCRTSVSASWDEDSGDMELEIIHISFLKNGKWHTISTEKHGAVPVHRFEEMGRMCMREG